MEAKVERAKRLIEDAVRRYPNIAVACSFGKDSMVTVHLARGVDPKIKIFSVMTRYKPLETFGYLVKMNRWMVADSVPEALKDDSLEVVLLPTDEFNDKASQIERQTRLKIYDVDPDECCRLLKVEPTRAALRHLDAWICGLRNT